MTRFALLILFCSIVCASSANATSSKLESMDLTPYDSANVKAALDEKFHLYDKQRATVPTQEEEWLSIQRTDNVTNRLAGKYGPNNRAMMEEMNKTRRYMGIDPSKAAKEVDNMERIDGIGISGSIKLP